MDRGVVLCARAGTVVGPTSTGSAWLTAACAVLALVYGVWLDTQAAWQSKSHPADSSAAARSVYASRPVSAGAGDAARDDGANALCLAPEDDADRALVDREDTEREP